jgi:hypothetical protein
MKTIEERRSILDKDIFKHVNHGWRIATRSDTKCLMIRDKKAKGFLLIFLLLLFIIPGIIYLYIDKGRNSLMIEVTEEGNIKYNATGLSDSEKAELMWY